MYNLIMTTILMPIDKFLNNITMYRLVLYGLSILALISLILSLFGLLPFNPIQFTLTFLITVTSCYLTNKLISTLLKAPTNYESSLISALILFFVIAPINNPRDALITTAAGVLAMVLKYLFAIRKKHLFNPVAISVLLLGWAGFGNAIWWVGSLNMLPFVLILGLLVVRKIRRFLLIIPYFVVGIVTMLIFNLQNQITPADSLVQFFSSWPSVFFATIMLTEPLTSPPNQKLRMLYSALVGLLYGSQFSFGFIHSSPEFALVVGNIFSYLVSPKQKLFLRFKNKTEIGANLYEIVMAKGGSFDYKPGQYLEWTLPHKGVDSRGNRRYFTIASSPTESDIKLGIKLFPDSSSFKNALVNLKPNDLMIGAALAGDFVLPSDPNQKLVFIAGGIGVTPFRSMIQYLNDTNQKRDIVMFYTCVSDKEFAYQSIFEKAKAIGLKTVYVLTGKGVPTTWQGEAGFLSPELIKKHTSDYAERTYYLSGPVVMVNSYKKLLSDMGIPPTRIVTDYFPGF